MPGGYGFNEGELRQVADMLGHASDELGPAGGKNITAPDAGVSSEVIADTMGMLYGNAAMAKALLTNVASKVDAADGSYANVELDANYAILDIGRN